MMCIGHDANKHARIHWGRAHLVGVMGCIAPQDEAEHRAAQLPLQLRTHAHAPSQGRLNIPQSTISLPVKAVCLEIMANLPVMMTQQRKAIRPP